MEHYTNDGTLEKAVLVYEILKFGTPIGKQFKTLKSACRCIDRLDLAYGGCVHSYRSYHTFYCGVSGLTGEG